MPIRAEHVQSPKDIALDEFASILQRHYYGSKDGDDIEEELSPSTRDARLTASTSASSVTVSSLDWKPLGRGVLSDVRIVDVTYGRRSCGDGAVEGDDNDNGDRDGGNGDKGGGASTDDDVSSPPHSSSQRRLPSRFLAKLRRPEIPLADLFPVESKFYELAAESSSASVLGDRSFPFRLVDAVAVGPSFILLEYVHNVTIIEMHLGCPPSRLPGIVDRLATMHARCWGGTFPGLSSFPGAGHGLPVPQREELFYPAWPAVRKRLVPFFNPAELERLDVIVSRTAEDGRIREAANAVARRKLTLVHGDFHVANMLFDKNEDGAHPPWLVDWSMAGFGNPIVDLVFFLIVGTSIGTDDEVDRVLDRYYRMLVDPTTSTHSDKICEELDGSAFSRGVRECVLNQFVILVCYDGLCRTMANGASSVEIRERHNGHFDRVNARCSRMLLSSG